MNTLFSKRHEIYIRKKKLAVSLPKRTRQRLIMCMENFDRTGAVYTDTGFQTYVSTFSDELPRVLKEAYGEEVLKAYGDNKLTPVSSIRDYIKNARPVRVIDAIEAFAGLTENSDEFQTKTNAIFASEELLYRFVGGHIVLLDSVYLESEILARANELLDSTKFQNALTDFNRARDNFTSGDYSGTISECNNSLESTIKCVVDDAKVVKQKSLKRLLMKSGIIPDYFEGFLNYFEGLVQSLFTIANKSSRHGDRDVPESKNVVDKAIASFFLHMTGTLLVFIIERFTEQQAPSEQPQVSASSVDIEFDDDIPF